MFYFNIIARNIRYAELRGGGHACALSQADAPHPLPPGFRCACSHHACVRGSDARLTRSTAAAESNALRSAREGVRVG